jgi:hypothetical protein
MYTTGQKITNTYLQCILNSDVFPDECKIAKVKSLYKKGDRYDIQNYSPISVLSIFSKLLKRLMYTIVG